MPVSPTLDLAPTPREMWRLGLESAAREAPAGTFLDSASPEGQRLGGGISYLPLTLGTSNAGSYDPCESPSLTFTQRDGSLTFLPWGIYVWEDCPSIGAIPQEAADRARQKLARQTSHLIEEVLWTGTLSDGATADLAALAATVTPSADNRPLASDSAVLIDGTGSHDLVDAFGYLAEYAAQQAGGERLWIHIEPRLLPFLAYYRQGFREGSRSLGQGLGDHRIVAGSGYDGSGPPAQTTASGESWIYLTTPVRVIEGPLQVPEDPEQFLDRSDNRFRPVANRLILAEWDLTVHGAIKVCLPQVTECSATGS